MLLHISWCHSLPCDRIISLHSCPTLAIGLYDLSSVPRFHSEEANRLPSLRFRLIIALSDLYTRVFLKKQGIERIVINSFVADISASLPIFRQACRYFGNKTSLAHRPYLIPTFSRDFPFVAASPEGAHSGGSSESFGIACACAQITAPRYAVSFPRD